MKKNNKSNWSKAPKLSKSKNALQQIQDFKFYNIDNKLNIKFQNNAYSFGIKHIKENVY